MSSLDGRHLAVILEAFRGAGFPGDSALILFGSYADGSAGPRSDLDLAVKAPGALPLAAWARFEELLEESELPFRVDVVDYHRVREPFRDVIDSEGVVLTEDHRG